MAPPILFLRDISLTFGGTPLLTSAELAVHESERLCLVGRNGSGKSTLLKIAAGLVEADSGERFVQPGVTVRYLPQEPDLSGYDSAIGYVEAGLAPGDDPHRARYLLERLGLTGNELPTRLSGGEQRRCAIARALAPEPDILLLDEPTNHLDLVAIEWLESELASMRSALVTISHDRRFLETLSNATVWIDRGTTRRHERGFSTFESWRDELLEREAEEHHKLGRKIAMEEDWLRYGVTARRKRNQRRLANLHELRRNYREHRKPTGTINLAGAEASTSSKLVAELSGVSKSFGDRKIVDSLDLKVSRRDRLGIVGPNGAGKTTLVKLITGEIAPDAGRGRLGTSLETVSLDQRRERLDPTWTLKDALTGGGGDMVHVGGTPRHVIGYMKDFLFSPEQAGTPISRLSGGERGRVMIARALARPSNLMVLDEPTNDLDLETLDLVQEYLADYDGTILLVSHDRDFLDRIVTSTLMAEGDGRWIEYAGGYSDAIRQRGGTAVGKPKTAAKKAGGGNRTPERTPPRPRARLSFKQKHALEKLPERIAELEERKAHLQEALARPDLYSTDPERFQKTASELEAVQADLDGAEEEWLELEMLREDIEGGQGAA